MRQAVAVDLDGTIVLTAAANVAAYRAALSCFGIVARNLDLQELAGGRHWSHVLPALLSGTEVDAAAVAARKRELYPMHLHLVVVNLPLVRTLRALQAGGAALALVTTASSAAVTAVLAHTALDGLFEVIVTGDDVLAHKPDPEGYLRAAAALGVQPRDMVVLEDSDTGCRAAVAAGAQVWRVSPQGR